MTATQPARTSTAPTHSLARPLALANDDMAAVNALILERASTDIALIGELARHLISGGGKRIRPLLTLLCARLCNYQGAQHIKLAAAVEFIHTATLLHDDVVDESKLRRGHATANEVFGNKESVLVGDYLFSQSFLLMVECGSIDVLGILSEASAVIAKGEVLQLMTQGEPATSREQYFRVIASKTAALFAAACEIGAVIAVRPEWREPLRAFGEHLGIAFQLVDDALDYRADESLLGKTLGDDFREGKITLPVLIAWENATEEERRFWQRTLSGTQEDADFAHALTLIHHHQGVEKTLEEARKYCATARKNLERLPANDHRAALEEIIDFCARRTH